MIIKEFAESVHHIAADHGWHEGGKETHYLEYIAMIHCELSEALQEYRAGRPLVYVVAHEVRGGMNNYMEQVVYMMGGGSNFDREIRNGAKPEGIAVEMADAVLRILDFLVEMKVEYWQWKTFDEMIADVPPADLEISFPVLVAKLHEATARAATGRYLNLVLLEPVMAYACAWIQKQGLDCELLLIGKSEYNKTREYRHGGKKC